MLPVFNCRVTALQLNDTSLCLSGLHFPGTTGPDGKPIAMCGKKIIDERPYLIEIQLSGGVRIHHRRMVV
jgi:hypothetical protein